MKATLTRDDDARLRPDRAYEIQAAARFLYERMVAYRAIPGHPDCDQQREDYGRYASEAMDELKELLRD